MTQTTSSWARVAGIVVLLAACLIAPFALVHHGDHQAMPGATTIDVDLRVPSTVCPGVPAPLVVTVAVGGAKVTPQQAKVSLQSTTVASPGASDWKNVSASFGANGVATVKTPASAVPAHYRLTVDAMAGYDLSQTSPIVEDVATPPAGVFAACVPALGPPTVGSHTLVTGEVMHVTGTAYHPAWSSPTYDTSSFSSGWAPFPGLPVQAVLTTTRTLNGRTTVTSSTLAKGVAAADGTYDLPVKISALPPSGVTLELSVVSPAGAATGPAVSVDAGSLTVSLPNAPTLAVTAPAANATLYAGEPLTISGTASGPIPTGATLIVKAGGTQLGTVKVGSGSAWTVTGTVPARTLPLTALTVSTSGVAGIASAQSFTASQQVALSMRQVVASGSVTLTPAAPAHGTGFLVTGVVKVSGSTAVALPGVAVSAWRVNADGTLAAKVAAVGDTTDGDGSFVLRFTQAKSVAGDYVVLAAKGPTWTASAYDPAHPAASSLYQFTVS